MSRLRPRNLGRGSRQDWGLKPDFLGGCHPDQLDQAAHPAGHRNHPYLHTHLPPPPPAQRRGGGGVLAVRSHVLTPQLSLVQRRVRRSEEEPAAATFKKLRCNMAREGGPGESSRRSVRQEPCPEGAYLGRYRLPAPEASPSAQASPLEGAKASPQPAGGCGLPHPRGTRDPPVTQPGRSGTEGEAGPAPRRGTHRRRSSPGRAPSRKGGLLPAFRLYRAGGRKRRGDNPRSASDSGQLPLLGGRTQSRERPVPGPRIGTRDRDPHRTRDRDPWLRPLPHAGPDPQRCRTALSPPPETQGVLGAGFPFSQLYPAVPYAPR